MWRRRRSPPASRSFSTSLSRLAALFRARIAVRGTAVILLIVGVVGLVFLAIALPLVQEHERADQQAQLSQLLDTVERTASIASFLADRELAEEVAGGLLSNRMVREVIMTSEGVELIHRTKADQPPTPVDALPPDTLRRRITSPFEPGKIAGEIAIVPDEAELRRTLAESMVFMTLLLQVQLVVTGLGVIIVVVRFIVRPIATISTRLHQLHAETGETIEIPSGHQRDEIGQLVRDVNGVTGSLVTTLEEEHRLRVEHQIEERKYHAIFDHADTGIFLIDEAGVLLSGNPAFAHMFGMPEPGAPDASPPALADLLGASGAQARDLIARAISEQRSVDVDLEFAGARGGSARWINITLSPADEHCLQGVANDITERKLTEDAAQHLATTDALTGLANRLAFDARLDQMMHAAHRYPERRFTILMVDLDWFKQVNDTYGHAAGDRVLEHVAKTLTDCVRKSDFVARIGGDEFVVLLDSTVQHDHVERIVKTMIAGIGQPIPVGGGHVATVGASVGIALFDGRTMSKEELIGRADEAMYAAKHGGRNTFQFHEALTQSVSA